MRSPIRQLPLNGGTFTHDCQQSVPRDVDHYLVSWKPGDGRHAEVTLLARGTSQSETASLAEGPQLPVIGCANVATYRA